MSGKGSVSSSSFASGFRSQERTGDETHGSDFRQVMSSYTHPRQEERDEERSTRETRQPKTERDAASADAATSDTQQSAQSTNSLTGSFGLRKSQDEDEQEAASTDAQAAESEAVASEEAASAAKAATSTQTPSAGLSPLQLLLKGGSRAEIVTPGEDTKLAAQQAKELANGEAEKKAISGGAIATAQANAFATKQATPAGLSKADKSKADSAKDSKATSGADSPLVDVTNMLLAPGQQASSGADAAGGNQADAARDGIALRHGSAPELLQAGGAQENGSTKPAANNFAFAVRLNAQEAHHTSAQAAEGTANAQGAPTLASETQHAIVAAAAAGLDEAQTPDHGGAHHEGAANETALMMAGEAAPVRAEQNSSPAAPQETAPAAGPEFIDAEAAATPTQPVRNVRLQLEGDNNQRVDIRLVEVAGEMRVSVRASDTKLAQTLQEHIPDLSKSLDQQRFRAEVYTPRTEGSAASNGSNVGSQSSRGEDAQGENGRRRDGQGRQQKQPEWVDELENYPSRNKSSRSNQLWPQ